MISMTRAEELYQKYDKGEMDATTFLKQFGKEEFLYSTPFGERKDGRKTLRSREKNDFPRGKSAVGGGGVGVEIDHGTPFLLSVCLHGSFPGESTLLLSLYHPAQERACRDCAGISGFVCRKRKAGPVPAFV